MADLETVYSSPPSVKQVKFGVSTVGARPSWPLVIDKFHPK